MRVLCLIGIHDWKYYFDTYSIGNKVYGRYRRVCRLCDRKEHLVNIGYNQAMWVKDMGASNMKISQSIFCEERCNLEFLSGVVVGMLIGFLLGFWLL